MFEEFCGLSIIPRLCTLFHSIEIQKTNWWIFLDVLFDVFCTSPLHIFKKKSRNADVANNKAIDFHISATLQANKCLG